MIRFLQTPGPVKKIVLGGLLLLVTVSMVWYLVPSSGNTSYNFGGPKQGVVAQVDGNEITSEEVKQTAQQMLQQQMPQGGANMRMLLPFFAQRAAEQLITRDALVAEAQRMGFHTTPEEVRDELQHGRYAATFFPGGNFIGHQEYEDMLQRANLTPTKFEEAVGKDILLTKLQAFISGSATVSESGIREQFIKQNTKVKFDYAVLKQDDIKKGLHPSDEEMKAFYESHK